MNRLAMVACALVGVCIAGCRSAPTDAGFGDVRDVVGGQSGYAVTWNHHSSADRSVDEAVGKLLAQKFSVDSAVQIALLNNRHLQATFEDLGIAQADLVQAGLLKNPIFNLGVRFPDKAPAGTYLDIGVTEDFLDIALIPARKRLAAGELNKAKAVVANEVFELVAKTKSDFYAYQDSLQLLELHKTLVQAADGSLVAATQLHDAGNMNDLDFATERAQAVRAKIELTDAQATASEAREKVSRDIGASAVQSEWTAAMDFPEIPVGDPDSKAALSLASTQRQDVVAARQEVEIQAKTLGLTADFRLFQNADLGPDFEHETDGQWRIGPTLSLPLPLFDQGQAKVSRAQAILIQSEQRCYAMELDAASETREAIGRLHSAREKAILYRDQVLPVQRDLMHQTELEYNGMYVGVFQLLQARRDEIEAAGQYMDAQRDYWTARAELERAIGGRIPIATAATEPSDKSHGERP